MLTWGSNNQLAQPLSSSRRSYGNFNIKAIDSGVWEFQSFRVPLTFFIVNVCILLKSRKTTLYRKNWQMTKICQIFL